MNRLLSCFFLCLLMTGCASFINKFHRLPPVRHSTSIISVTRALPPFTRISVVGPVNVRLHTTNTSSVTLQGDRNDLAKTTSIVRQGQLIIRVDAKYPPLNLDINTPILTRFIYNGVGDIVGTNLHASSLDLVIGNAGRTTLQGQLNIRHLVVKSDGVTLINGIHSNNLQIRLRGNPQVQLIGMASVQSLDIDGGGRLNMYWLKSNLLTIRAHGETMLQLAGLVDKLDVELWDRVHFDGRYLRSKRLFAKTHDFAVADIAAIAHQHTLARDRSNIYFYNLPTLKADFMDHDGSVLDMRDWNPVFWRDYTQYNK